MQRRPGFGLPTEIRPRDGPDENAVTGEEIPIVEPKRNQTEGVAGDVKCLEFVLPRRESLPVANKLVGNRRGQQVDGMNGVMWMQIVGGTSLGGESRSATDVVRVPVGVNHRFDREAHTTSQVQVMMKVTQGVDHDRLPRACDYVAQASSRWPGYLVDRQLGPFDQSAGRIVLTRLSSHP